MVFSLVLALVWALVLRGLFCRVLSIQRKQLV
jgi:hypothetical protein